MSFLAEVKAKIFEAKFILEQERNPEGNQKAIEKLRNALDLCAIAERLIDVLAPVQKRVIEDTLSSSLADPKFTSEPPTTPKDEP